MPADPVTEPDDMLVRIGHITRILHDNLRELGLDKVLEKATHDIPDVRDRLNYVARMTEQAAQRVLNATDTAIPLQDRIGGDAKQLSAAWQQLLVAGAGAPDGAAWQALAQQTVAALDGAAAGSSETKAHLMDIMMAQDFQDLTGQVIKKVTSIAQNLEKQLVQMLIDFAPEQMKKEIDNGLLNGPQIDPKGEGVVADQEQVDDLLDSLGF